jgi:hypothetical protein
MFSVNQDIVIRFVDIIKPLSFSYPEKDVKIFLTNLKRFLLDNTA